MGLAAPVLEGGLEVSDPSEPLRPWTMGEGLCPLDELAPPTERVAHDRTPAFDVDRVCSGEYSPLLAPLSKGSLTAPISIACWSSGLGLLEGGAVLPLVVGAPDDVSSEKPSLRSRWTHQCSARTIWAMAETETTSQKKNEAGKCAE